MKPDRADPEVGPAADPGDGRDADFVAFAAVAGPRLARTAWLLTGSAAESEDLVQEALLRTCLAWRRVRLDDPLAYARRAMVNRHVDGWRRAKREVAAWIRHGTDPDRLEDASHTTADRDLVVRLLQQLTSRERVVLVLRHYAGLPESQIAQELGISVGTVKSTAWRARGRLRALWPDLLAEPSQGDGPDTPTARRLS